MRSPFRYVGGKGRIWQKILPELSRCSLYVEPFCGGASVFWNKRPDSAEILNDLNGDIVHLYRVLQDEKLYRILEDKIRYTLYSREEFRLSLENRKRETLSDVERAWTFYVFQNLGFGGKTESTEGSWGRSMVPRNNWTSRKDCFREWHDRLQNVRLETRDCLELLEEYDDKDTLFYLDPPYVLGTRKEKNFYKFEGSDDFHNQLIDRMLKAKGKIILSGYSHPLYDVLVEKGWLRKELETISHVYLTGRAGTGSRGDTGKRTECLWINKNSFFV